MASGYIQVAAIPGTGRENLSITYRSLPDGTLAKITTDKGIIAAVLVLKTHHWLHHSIDCCLEQSRSGSEVAIWNLLRCWHLPGSDKCQVRCVQFNQRYSIWLRLLAPFTWIACAEI